MEPLTSFLIRETTIAAKAAGKLSEALWQIASVLRKHLQPEIASARMAPTRGRSGAERSGAGPQPVLSDPFQADLFQGDLVREQPVDLDDPKNRGKSG